MRASGSGRCSGLAAAVLVIVAHRRGIGRCSRAACICTRRIVPKDLDLETQLEAGTLLYYRDGAAATVSVKRLTGTTTLAVDGKTDASNRSDMLTQKLVAHLPLLLHDDPRNVAIIGLGSGVTLGAALQSSRRPRRCRRDLARGRRGVTFLRRRESRTRSPIRARTSSSATAARTCCCRRRQYDVIISEPSNPWIAGVAALFTREFFEAARARLAPGGIICQWAHTYNDQRPRSARRSSRPSRRSFRTARAWMVDDDDVLMVGVDDSRSSRCSRNIERNWSRGHCRRRTSPRSGRRAVRRAVAVRRRPGRAARATRAGARTCSTTTACALEFSAPRELHSASADENDASFVAVAWIPSTHPRSSATGRRARRSRLAQRVPT